MKKNMALIFTTISIMSLIAVITGYVLDATGLYGAGFYLIGIGESTCITSAAVVVAIGIFDNKKKKKNALSTKKARKLYQLE